MFFVVSGGFKPASMCYNASIVFQGVWAGQVVSSWLSLFLFFPFVLLCFPLLHVGLNCCRSLWESFLKFSAALGGFNPLGNFGVC